MNKTRPNLSSSANQAPVNPASAAVRPASFIGEFLQKPALVFFLLGFTAGIPILLIFSTLSLWLGEAGIKRETVTFFSWAALAYSFKFVWAPLVDRIPLPVLGRLLGHRRSWILLAQLAIAGSIVLMGSIDPARPGEHQLLYCALAAALLGFSAATQDIVVDAARIELPPEINQTTIASTYTAGYRLGMIASGAGALWLASWLGTSKGNYVFDAWAHTYQAMAVLITAGMAATLWMDRPPVAVQPAGSLLSRYTARHYAQIFLAFLAGVVTFAGGMYEIGSLLPETTEPLLVFLYQTLRFAGAALLAAVTVFLLTRTGLVNRKLVKDTWVQPVESFFGTYGIKTAGLLLLLIGVYRISDIVAGVISNVFYQDLGFSKDEIARAVKTFGVIVSLAGGFTGAWLARKMPVIHIMLVGAVTSCLSNLVFVGLAHAGHNSQWLYFAVSVDNFAAGLASAAFVAFLSGLTNISFSASQYAIFSSLMTLIPKLIGGYSGTLATRWGYPGFFVFTTLLGLPVVALVYQVGKLRHAMALSRAAEPGPG